MPVSERHSKLVYDALVAAGVEVVSALPETWLVHLIRLAEDDPEMILVRLAKEEEGVGVSAGAHLAGRQVGHADAEPRPAPVGQRHRLAGPALQDPPAHADQRPRPPGRARPLADGQGGRATRPILDALGIVTDELRDPATVQLQVARAMTLAQASLAPVALLLTRDLMWEVRLASRGSGNPKGVPR